MPSHLTHSTVQKRHFLALTPAELDLAPSLGAKQTGHAGSGLGLQEIQGGTNLPPLQAGGPLDNSITPAKLTHRAGVGSEVPLRRVDSEQFRVAAKGQGGV